MSCWSAAAWQNCLPRSCTPFPEASDNCGYRGIKSWPKSYQLRRTLKSHPCSRTLCGTDWSLCCERIRTHLLWLSILSLNLQVLIPRTLPNQPPVLNFTWSLLPREHDLQHQNCENKQKWESRKQKILSLRGLKW